MEHRHESEDYFRNRSKGKGNYWRNKEWDDESDKYPEIEEIPGENIYDQIKELPDELPDKHSDKISEQHNESGDPLLDFVPLAIIVISREELDRFEGRTKNPKLTGGTNG